MEYLLLIYQAEALWESKSDEEKQAVFARHSQLGANLTAASVAYTGKPLMSTASAVSVRTSGGERQVTDGPFAETKEQLGGFYLIDAESLEQAIEFAAQIPTESGTIEVRPIAQH